LSTRNSTYDAACASEPPAGPGRPAGTVAGTVMNRDLPLSDAFVYVKQGLEVLSEASDREEDIMDKAFDVKATSRLSCQSKIQSDATIVVEISRESRQAFLDEHPEIRAALKAAAGGGSR